MKVQIRRNILTHKFEVQTRQDQKAKWKVLQVCETRADAERIAAELEQPNANALKSPQTSASDKSHTEKKKTAQNAKKRGTRGKEKTK